MAIEICMAFTSDTTGYSLSSMFLSYIQYFVCVLFHKLLESMSMSQIHCCEICGYLKCKFSFTIL